MPVGCLASFYLLCLTVSYSVHLCCSAGVLRVCSVFFPRFSLTRVSDPVLIFTILYCTFRNLSCLASLSPSKGLRRTKLRRTKLPPSSPLLPLPSHCLPSFTSALQKVSGVGNLPAEVEISAVVSYVKHMLWRIQDSQL